MNPINLLLPDGTPSKVWACGECKMTCRDEASAKLCCTPIPCRYCLKPADKKFRHGYESADHDACRTAEGSRRDAERLEKAEKLEDWDGWVWDENRYYESLEAYVDHLDCNFEEPEDWPDWVYVAEASPATISLNVDDILEGVCEDGYDDMADDLNGVKELEAAIKAFQKANEGIIVYDGDWTRAVRVPKPTSVSEPPEARTDA